MTLSIKLLLASALYFGAVYLIFLFGNTDLLLIAITFSLMIPIVYLLHDRYKHKQHIATLNQETLKAELELLKSQINPHFFFNTLNNLYGLASQNSRDTQETIYKLAQMMRFTIYEGRKNTIKIKDEVQYLENFIELNTIRYKNNVHIVFNKEIQDYEQQIPPLLFINLLENAFKHGVDTQLGGQKINIMFVTNQRQLKFTIKNNFCAETLEKNKKIKGSGGLGIVNLSRRLELLFPERYKYDKKVTKDIYVAAVTINLN